MFLMVKNSSIRFALILSPCLVRYQKLLALLSPFALPSLCYLNLCARLEVTVYEVHSSVDRLDHVFVSRCTPLSDMNIKIMGFVCINFQLKGQANSCWRISVAHELSAKDMGVMMVVWWKCGIKLSEKFLRVDWRNRGQCVHVNELGCGSSKDDDWPDEEKLNCGVVPRVGADD